MRSTTPTAAKANSALGFSDIPFDIPNLRVENGPAENHVRIGWLRSVANIYHTFAVQSFADELAHAANQDSLEYLLALIGPDRVSPQRTRRIPTTAPTTANIRSTPARLRHVTELAAEKAGWGKRKLGKGRGMGIAAHRSFLTYVATVVEVEVTPAGDVVIHEVNTAVDAGTVVNPETLNSQFEGAAVFGTSLALFSEITATNGAIEQTNFHQYQVARMNQSPRKTNVYMVESNAPRRRRRRTRSSAVRSGAVQRDLRSHGQTHPRTPHLEDEPQLLIV